MGEIAMPNWCAIRTEYSALAQGCYLNSARIGLLSNRVLQTAIEQLEQYGQQTSALLPDQQQVEQVRSAVKQVLNAQQHLLAFTPSMTYGLQSLVAAFRQKKRVLVLSTDYPSLHFFWCNHGHDLSVFPTNMPLIALDYQAYFDFILANKINLLAISHVNNISGYRLSLARIYQFCQQHNIILLLDATQSFALHDIDMTKYPDMIVLASGHKWLNAGRGIGFICLPRNLLAQIQFEFTSELLVNKDMLLEISHYNYEGIFRLAAALTFMQEIGLKQIEQRVLSLVQVFQQRLIQVHSYQPLASRHQSGIILLPKNAAFIADLHTEQVSFTELEYGLRFSCHYYNNEQEMCLLAELASSHLN